MKSKTEPLPISPRILGMLNLPDFCAFCFLFAWLVLLERAVFPSIFNLIDIFTKKAALGFAGQQLPLWLAQAGGFIRALPTPSWQRFKWIDPASNLLLRGSPDGFFERFDHTLAIGDFKCARYTPGQEKLLPLYEVQLNCYSFLAPRARSLSLPRCTWLGLIYTAPEIEVTVEDVRRLLRPDGFMMPFSGTIVEVSNHPDELIPVLLRRAREILDGPVPAPNPECARCQRLIRLIASIADGNPRAVRRGRITTSRARS